MSDADGNPTPEEREEYLLAQRKARLTEDLLRFSDVLVFLLGVFLLFTGEFGLLFFLVLFAWMSGRWKAGDR